MEEIPEADLIEGQIYEVRSRNLIVGVWRPETRGFIGLRTKFGSRYLFEEFHWDTGPPFGTARAVRELEGFVIPKRVVRRFRYGSGDDTMFRVVDALDKLVARVVRLEDDLGYEYGVRTYDMTDAGDDGRWQPKANFQAVNNEKVAWYMADLYARRESDATHVKAIVVRRRATSWEVVERDLDKFPPRE